MVSTRGYDLELFQAYMLILQSLINTVFILVKLFNLSMTYNLDSDFPNLYGKFAPVLPHPPADSEELEKIIRDFADSNKHLAGKEKGALAVQFVSNCETQSRRNVIVQSVRSVNQLMT